MASWSIPVLGFHRIPGSHRNNRRARIHLLQTRTRRILSVRLRFLPVRLPIPTLLHLRSLLDRPLAHLSMEMGILAQILGKRMGLRRPRLLHPQRTIRTRRDLKGTIRTDGPRSSTEHARNVARARWGDMSVPSPEFFQKANCGLSIRCTKLLGEA